MTLLPGHRPYLKDNDKLYGWYIIIAFWPSLTIDIITINHKWNVKYCFKIWNLVLRLTLDLGHLLSPDRSFWYKQIYCTVSCESGYKCCSTAILGYSTVILIIYITWVITLHCTCLNLVTFCCMKIIINIIHNILI